MLSRALDYSLSHSRQILHVLEKLDSQELASIFFYYGIG